MIVLNRKKVNVALPETSIVENYFTYCKSQENNKVLWFFIPTMFYACFIPIIAVIIYTIDLPSSIYAEILGLAGFNMYANIILSVIEVPMKYRIFFFFASIKLTGFITFFAFLFT